MLLDSKGIEENVHVIGHDIGSIIAFTLSSRWSEGTASLCVSECLLPGTAAFDNERREHPVTYFHHTFHCLENPPQYLTAGREKMNVEYFVNKLCYRLGAIPLSVIDRYAKGMRIQVRSDAHCSYSKDLNRTQKTLCGG